MGGWKCSYRTCTVRKDNKSKVHIFHYPVFDKVRCHKWLNNCQRPDFLQLTVAQLKNRVVCEHHFEDDCFMNYNKNSLKFDAVPTLDGPFCTSSNKTKENMSSTSISIEDIDKEEIICDRKSTYTKKYSSFLTNYDEDEAVMLESPKQPEQVNNKNYLGLYYQDNNIIITNPNFGENRKTEPINTVDELFVNNNNFAERIIYEVPVINSNVKKENLNNKISKVTQINSSTILKPTCYTPKEKPILKTTSNNSLENINFTNFDCKPGSTVLKKANNIKVLEIETIRQPNEVKETLNIEAPIQNLKNKQSEQNKLELNKKRIFNKKLVNVLDTSFDHIGHKVQLNKSEGINKTENIIKQNPLRKNIIKDTFEIEEEMDSQPSSTNIMNWFDSRLRIMEKNLLDKIQSNTQNITELKDEIVTNTSKTNSVSVSSQTGDVCYKKYLFYEISKHLSPELNNMIFEELFIDKHVKPTFTKKRKR